MPEETPEGGAGTAPAQEGPPGAEAPFAPTFTQEDVDRIVTERLRRERQRAEKAARDEYEGRIAELEAAAQAGHEALRQLNDTKNELHAARKQALVTERVMARAQSRGTGPLPPPYLAQIDGEDEESVDTAIAAAEEQWQADLRLYGRKAIDVGRPTNPAGARATAVPVVDVDLAERMRRGDPEAFRQYAAVRR
jgi:hypothetical protein